MSKTILTGIKPTGNPHFGNFAGMIRPMIDLVNSKEEDDKILLFIANHHALNGLQDRKLLKEYTYDLVASLVALGLDPKKVVLFKQSDIYQVFELTSILMNYTPKGLMNRAHAYKASIDKNREAGKEDVDAGINMGLYTYPVLMAADILVYGSNIVPVGKDQIQHVEIARDLAGSFNHLHTETLVLPNYKVQKDLEAIPGLDGRKMSKSYGNTIPLFAEENQLKKAIMRIVTDSKTPEEKKDPEGNTIYELYKLFATEEQVQEFGDKFRAGGLGYGDAKKELFDVANAYLSGPRERYKELLSNTKELDAILEEGARNAGYMAEKTMRKVRKRLGF